MQSLLQKAKAVKVNVRKTENLTDQHKELALAWATGQVGISQVEEALYGRTGGPNSYVVMARCLRSLVQEGKLVIK